jgi:hypothetical protein
VDCDSSEPGKFRISIRLISSYGPDYGRGKSILKFHRHLSPFANVIHESRPETSNARSPTMPNARINHACRFIFQEFLRQFLGGCVTVWVEALGKTGLATDIVELSSKVCQEVDTQESLFLLPVDLLKLLRLVKGHFNSGRFERESRIPRAALGPIETASERAGLSECRIDDVGIREPEHELPNRDPRQEPCLALEPLVGCSFEFE